MKRRNTSMASSKPNETAKWLVNDTKYKKSTNMNPYRDGKAVHNKILQKGTRIVKTKSLRLYAQNNSNKDYFAYLFVITPLSVNGVLVFQFWQPERSCQ